MGLARLKNADAKECAAWHAFAKENVFKRHYSIMKFQVQRLHNLGGEPS
jgi:hypothetical protein